MLLNTIEKNETNSTEKFQNAEQLWFWFLYSKSIQNGFHFTNLLYIGLVKYWM